MEARYGGRTGLGRVAIAAFLAASLIAPAAISAQEADQSAPPPPSSSEVATAPPIAQPPAGSDDSATATAPSETPAPGATDAAAASASTAPASATVEATPVTVSRASASASKAVSIINFAYSPAALTVNTGDSVTWTNKDKAPEGHDVTGDGLDSGLMNQGDTYSFTFNSAGSYSYICTIHPSMTGTVEVLARSGGSGGDAGAGGSSGADSSDAVIESEAIASPDAAGTATSLPASGEPVAGMVATSLLLLALGLLLRALPAIRAGS
jgi:plastocyanin